MIRKFILVGAASAALAMVLTACGKDSGKADAGSTGGSGSKATIASKLILGGPPEFETRVDGVPGLQHNYGVAFGGYKVLDTGGPVTVTALKNGQVDAADLFTTDPSIAANNFVILADPKSDFAAQNVLPLINKAKATPGSAKVLNAVSAKLDTASLSAILTKVQNDKQDPDTVAKQWLKDQGLDAGGTDAAGVAVTVGSANFPESVALADIYAEALKDQGAKVSTKPSIGAREVYIPGLKDGSIDLIPEYSGSILQYFDPKATATSPDDVYAALQKALPAGLTVLDQSKAQDSDAIVVTKATADKYGLKSIADLAKTQ
ncbi:glycine betaine ABC transporter substrate-binding protein [Catenulispora rubra]|uniref:glycine betaine ABC transporter substrate-binding protein n=1 Tax=Catenulispora rubra TaxID=280293 RepID=UPI001E4DDCC5|nr:glycine betaine ABC transporter substrate-binding protein [Catenulispora rubra]